MGRWRHTRPFAGAIRDFRAHYAQSRCLGSALPHLPRPLWSFVLAILATALVVSAAFILVMQVADSRHDKKMKLSFSASIAPILPGTEPSTALPNAYSVLGRAKESAHSRLLVVFDKAYEHPASHREELEKDLHGVQAELKAELEKDPESVRADAARAEIRKLEKRIDILTKAELLFAPKRVNLPLAT